MKITLTLAALVLTLPVTLHAQTVTPKLSDAGLRVEIDGQVFTEYVTEDTPRPFMYPLMHSTATASAITTSGASAEEFTTVQPADGRQKTGQRLDR